MTHRMRSARWRVMAVGLVLLAAGCSRGDASPRQTVAACSVPKVDTTGWVRQDGPYPGYSFLLPPGFQEDTAGLFIHGGTRWRAGPLVFDRANGYWSPASFRGTYAKEPPKDPGYSECWDTIGGLRVFLSTRHRDSLYEASAWFPDPRMPQNGFRGYEIVLGGHGSSLRDQELFLGIFRTVAPVPAP